MSHWMMYGFYDVGAHSYMKNVSMKLCTLHLDGMLIHTYSYVFPKMFSKEYLGKNAATTFS